jgi:monodictyphenone polyketide synthase
VQFIKNAIPEVSITTPTLRRGIDNFVSMSEMLSTLYNAGIEINWHEWHIPFEKNLRLLSDLPAYSWNNKNYWIQYEGDWMLSKNLVPTQSAVPAAVPSTLRTSLVHQVLEDEVAEEAGYLVIRSDLMQPEFLEAANGHRMNGHGVVTSVSDFFHPLITTNTNCASLSTPMLALH